MPPAIASRFTTGEQAALAVVAREVQSYGRCTLYLDAIAGKAGGGTTTVRNAIAQAERLGLVKKTERRIPGRKSLSNVVEIRRPGWPELTKRPLDTHKETKQEHQAALRKAAGGVRSGLNPALFSDIACSAPHT